MDNAEKKILDLITGEPGYWLVSYKICRLCKTPRLASEVEEALRAFPGMKVATWWWAITAAGVDV